MMKVGQLIRESVINQLTADMTRRRSVFLIGYSGVSSVRMNSLRKALRKAGANLYVSKNSIAQRALKGLHYDKLADNVSGQMAFVLSDADAVEVSKVLTKFVKDCQGVLIRGGLLQNAILEKRDIERLSELPSRGTLLVMLLWALQSPVVRLAAALNSKTYDLLNVLKQLSEREGGK